MFVSHKYLRGSIRLATLGVALCLSLAQISSAQGATHFIAKGSSARWVSFSDDERSDCAGQVFTDFATGPNAQTFMLINYFRETPPTRLEVFGFGLIPNEAFHGDSASHMSLNLDLSQATGFTSCFTDFSTGGTPTCTDSPTGTISVDWKKPAFSVQETETFRRERGDFGRMTFFFVGTDQNTAAMTSVRAFDLDLHGVGVMGISRQMTLTIERKQ